MKFLADMGISQSSINWLRQNEYDAIHLRGEGLHRVTDAEIIKKATKGGRIILTCDLDFGDLRSANRIIEARHKNRKIDFRELFNTLWLIKLGGLK